MITTKERWIDLGALAALAVLALLFFWKIALTNLILTSQDMFAYFYPYRDFANEALRTGQLPLWNPYLFMGAPLLANSQVAVLYPLHWPLIWLSPAKQVAWSIVLHIWLAGAGAYVFARRATRLHPVPSFAAAVVFGLGGFLGAQVGHLNQLNASAWLPWLLLCVHVAAHDREERWLALLGGAAIVGLILLAGHTQTAYIVLFGAATFAIWLAIHGILLRRAKRSIELHGLAALVTMVLIGGVLALGQLLPTLELSRLSVRSGGLPYNLATSFSLPPGQIFQTFLPPLIWEPPFTEYVAYVGLVGLGLALVGTWSTLRQQQPGGGVLVLALVGVFLAFGRYNPLYLLFYKLIPGFDLFRAPSRWLLLYSFGAALLAGIGLEVVHEHRAWRWRRILEGALVLLLVAELFLASRRLPYNNPTAPAAFHSMRTAPAHLLADDSADPFRFLSMSDIRYDPGDMADLQTMYASTLPEEAIYDLIVATKVKEVIGFNLPLRDRIYSLDGYDGGLLPINRYVMLEHLFLPEEEISLDGRLREQLRQIPPNRLLSPLNVKYIITDKTQDVWIDDVFYDLEHTAPLGETTLTDIPGFEATQLGVVSYLSDTMELADGTPVAEITLAGLENQTTTMRLLAGEHTSEGLHQARSVSHRQARVGHAWRDNVQGSDYVAALDLGQPMQPVSITVQSLLPGEHFYLRGLTLIDERTGTSRILPIDPAYRLVHSGDVKIYQNLNVLPRAFVVHQARVVTGEEATLDILDDPGFDLGSQVVLATGQPLDAQPAASHVEILSYAPEEIELQVTTGETGYLVLTDTYYPGWTAAVDGTPVPIHRADLYFRAVALQPGEHQVVFRYRPVATYVGLAASLFAWPAWVLAFAVAAHHIGRKRPSSV